MGRRRNPAGAGIGAQGSTIAPASSPCPTSAPRRHSAQEIRFIRLFRDEIEGKAIGAYLESSQSFRDRRSPCRAKTLSSCWVDGKGIASASCSGFRRGSTAPRPRCGSIWSGISRRSSARAVAARLPTATTGRSAGCVICRSWMPRRAFMCNVSAWIAPTAAAWSSSCPGWPSTPARHAAWQRAWRG